MSSFRAKPHRKHRGASAPALVCIVLCLGLGSALSSRAAAQTAPGYIALFQDPPRTDQLTQADLPNLGRLVVLEATSMFVHARSDLYGSPESFYLLNDITTVWHAADAFVAAVSYYPSEAERLQAGRLVFPNLQAAYDRLRDRIQQFPGSSQRVFLNLAYMSRPMAVIPPLLGQNPVVATPAQAAAAVSTGPTVPSLVTVRVLARELLPAIQNLRAERTKTPVAADHTDDSVINRQLEILDNLLAGLDWIAYGGVDPNELVASVRPIPPLAQQLDLRMQRRGLVEPLQSQWNAIKQRIDALASQFQLPREIIPLAAGGKPLFDIGVVTPINEAINQIEPLLGPPAQGQGAVAGAVRGASPVAGDLQRLRTRLFLLRQYVLAQSPRSQIARAVRDLESALGRLEADSGAQRVDPRGGMDKLIRSVQQAAGKITAGRPASH